MKTPVTEYWKENLDVLKKKFIVRTNSQKEQQHPFITLVEHPMFYAGHFFHHNPSDRY
jgi:hypothetical protein